MPSAISVAKEFVRLSYSGSEADPLTNLRLQKLLYYAQAWSLVIREFDLFTEPIEAWLNGPVVRAVYKHFPAKQKAFPIVPEQFADVPDLVEDYVPFVKAVWRAFRGYSASSLWRKTHREQPYLKAWADRPRDGTERGTDEMTADTLVAYFSEQTVPTALKEYRSAAIEREKRALTMLKSIPQFDPAILAKRTKFRTRRAHEDYLRRAAS